MAEASKALASAAPSADDLQENRAGLLSARQETMLRGALRWQPLPLSFHPDDPARALDGTEDINSILLSALLVIALGFGAAGLFVGEPVLLLVCAIFVVPIAGALLMGAHRQWFRVVFGRTHEKLARAALADVTAGRVAGAIGQVTFEHGRYVVRCEGKLMRLPRGEEWRLPLTPGALRVHYLPESRIILAVEPAAAVERADPGYRKPPSDDLALSVDTGALTAALATAHRFDVRWLPQNRRGELARGQVLRALSEVQIQLAMMGTLFGTCAVVVWAAPLLVGITFGFFFGSMGLLVAVEVLGVVWRVVRDWIAGKVVTLEGPIQVERTPVLRSTPAYWYVIGGERLRVEAEAARALVEGVRYRVWILPRARRVVGIEPVGGSAPR
ncbi:MAG: hypothetical protein QM820_18200 [Minicystis sp.]